MSVTYIK